MYDGLRWRWGSCSFPIAGMPWLETNSQPDAELPVCNNPGMERISGGSNIMRSWYEDTLAWYNLNLVHLFFYSVVIEVCLEENWNLIPDRMHFLLGFCLDLGKTRERRGKMPKIACEKNRFIWKQFSSLTLLFPFTVLLETQM